MFDCVHEGLANKVHHQVIKETRMPEARNKLKVYLLLPLHGYSRSEGEHNPQPERGFEVWARQH
ncbi:hypothetical protein M8C21_028852, partial [Ambrosia artemisiifolia]